MGQPAARISDMHVCPMQTPGTPPIPHVGGPILPPGAPTVLVGNLPAACVGDMCVCVGPPDSIITGAFTVLFGNKPAARMGSSTAHGGTVTIGFPTVLLGDGLSAISAVVSPEVMDLIVQSPTLVAILIGLSNNGWTVTQGTPGRGTFADRTVRGIFIDPNNLNNSNYITEVLAHEAGHAAYQLDTEDPYIDMDGLTKDEYVNANTHRNLRDEGEATLVNAEVREEIMNTSGTDIGIAGSASNSQTYLDAYEQYKVDGDREAARDTIGNTYAHGERPSTHATGDYYDYYSQSYVDHWDQHNP